MSRINSVSLGFKVWGLGFRVHRARGLSPQYSFGRGMFRAVRDLGFGVWDLEFRIWGSGFGVWGLWLRVSGLRFRVYGLEFGG